MMPLGTSGTAGWEPHHLDEEQKPEEPADLKVEATSPDKTTTDRRVPEGHSAVLLLFASWARGLECLNSDTIS